ncbi:MAG: hypothetical protein ACFCD0_29190 [Gemmataceae bacterium]
MRKIRTSLLILGLLTSVVLTGCPPKKETLAKDDPLVGGNPVVSKSTPTSFVPEPIPIDGGSTPASLTAGNLPGAVPLRMAEGTKKRNVNSGNSPRWQSLKNSANDTNPSETTNTSKTQTTKEESSKITPKMLKPEPAPLKAIQGTEQPNPRSNSTTSRPKVTAPTKQENQKQTQTETRHTTQYVSAQDGNTNPVVTALKSLKVTWKEERVKEGIRVIADIPDPKYSDGTHFRRIPITAPDREQALRAVLLRATEVPKKF